MRSLKKRAVRNVNREEDTRSSTFERRGEEAKDMLKGDGIDSTSITQTQIVANRGRMSKSKANSFLFPCRRERGINF